MPARYANPEGGRLMRGSCRLQMMMALLLAAGSLSSPASAADAPTRGGTAVIAVVADPGQLNPGITTSSNVHAVADSLFNGLVQLDAELKPVPDLAASWAVSDDSTVFTFTLAPARWHDAVPVTAADVKFTFEDVLFKYHARTKAGLGAVIAAIETPDDR